MTQAAASTIGGFLVWWLSELRSAFPALFEQAMPKAVNIITPLPGGLYALAKMGAGSPAVEGDARVIAGACGAKERADLPNVLRLPAASVFVRRLEVPDQAMGKLRRILTLDLDNATPFSADEASFDFITARASTNGRRQVRQVIVKNSILETIVGDLRRHGLQLRAVDAEGAEGVNLAPENLRLKSRPRFRSEFLLLIVSIVAAYAALYYRQERLIGDLESRRSEVDAATGAVRAAAADANAASANIEALRRRQEERPLALSTLASLTRVLDDSVWLTELSISGRDITLSGYAASAAKVISDLEASDEFEQASFSTAVFTDEPTNSERFSARLRAAEGVPQGAAESGRGE